MSIVVFQKIRFPVDVQDGKIDIKDSTNHGRRIKRNTVYLLPPLLQEDRLLKKMVEKEHQGEDTNGGRRHLRRHLLLLLLHDRDRDHDHDLQSVDMMLVRQKQ